MRDMHQMVINDIGKMICRESIALEEYGIWRDIPVAPCYIAHEDIMECRLALSRDTEADNRLYSLCLILSTLCLCEVRTVSVISLILALGFSLFLPDSLKTLRRAVAVICLSFGYQLLGILLVDIKALRLDIRTIRAAYDRTFVPLYTKPFKSAVKILKRLIRVPFPVSILNTEYELTP